MHPPYYNSSGKTDGSGIHLAYELCTLYEIRLAKIEHNDNFHPSDFTEMEIRVSMKAASIWNERIVCFCPYFIQICSTRNVSYSKLYTVKLNIYIYIYENTQWYA